jgi:hypothetical protein
MNDGRTVLDQPETPAARRLYTYEELVAQFPESKQPCELWDGEIVTPPAPSFDHQKIALRFYRQLHASVSPRNSVR